MARGVPEQELDGNGIPLDERPALEGLTRAAARLAGRSEAAAPVPYWLPFTLRPSSASVPAPALLFST